MTTDAQTRLLHSIEEAQDVLGGIGRTTLYDLGRRGLVQFVKIGRRTFVTAESLAGYVASLSERREGAA